MLTRNRSILTALALIPTLASGGCVFDKIHKELVNINATTARTSNTLAVATESLATANETLVHLQTQLEQVERTNLLLLQLQAGLGTEDIEALSADPNAAPQRRSILTTLTSIDASLGKLDDHLASLRRTLENIDSTIPFLGFADPASDEAPVDPNAPIDPDAPPDAAEPVDPPIPPAPPTNPQ